MRSLASNQPSSVAKNVHFHAGKSIFFVSNALVHFCLSPLGLKWFSEPVGRWCREAWRAKGGAELEMHGSARHECGARRVGLSGHPYPPAGMPQSLLLINKHSLPQPGYDPPPKSGPPLQMLCWLHFGEHNACVYDHFPSKYRFSLGFFH